MGIRGPKPLPAALKKLRGRNKKKGKGKEPARERAAVPAPKPLVAIPGVPESMQYDEIAAKCWKKLSKALVAMKLLAENDRIALEGLCIAYSRAMQADEIVRVHGVVIVDAVYGLKANPATSLSRQSWIEVRKFAAEFGLTPSSRTRVHQVPDEDEGNETEGGKQSAEKFLFGRHPARVVGRIGA